MEIKRDLYLGQRSLEICWEKSKIDEKVLANVLRTIVLKWKIRYNIQK